MNMNPVTSRKAIIGRDAFVALAGVAENVPAKVDTGADTSAIWASDIFVDKDLKLKTVVLIFIRAFNGSIYILYLAV